jgi:mRNA interferase RelE/StbE
MSYLLDLNPDARRSLSKLREPLLSRVEAALDALRDNARPPGCLKLSSLDEWRVRLGKIRIRYVIDDDLRLVVVIGIDARDKAYRRS